jgi:hypothetical protein
MHGAIGSEWHELLGGKLDLWTLSWEGMMLLANLEDTVARALHNLLMSRCEWVIRINALAAVDRFFSSCNDMI